MGCRKGSEAKAKDALGCTAASCQWPRRVSGTVVSSIQLLHLRTTENFILLLSTSLCFILLQYASLISDAEVVAASRLIARIITPQIIIVRRYVLQSELVVLFEQA